jgi:hypothetical protein
MGCGAVLETLFYNGATKRETSSSIFATGCRCFSIKVFYGRITGIKYEPAEVPILKRRNTCWSLRKAWSMERKKWDWRLKYTILFLWIFLFS